MDFSRFFQLSALVEQRGPSIGEGEFEEKFYLFVFARLDGVHHEKKEEPGRKLERRWRRRPVGVRLQDEMSSDGTLTPSFIWIRFWT